MRCPVWSLPQGRPPAHSPGGALPGGLVRAQSTAATMQQRLQHKFGEEAAAFMLHDLKQVGEGCSRGRSI